MKVVHIADIHIDRNRLDDHRSQLASIVDDMLSTGADLALFGGDYFKRVAVDGSAEEWDILATALVSIAGAMPVVCLGGNHDRLPDIQLAQHLGGAYPIRVVNGAEVIEVDTPAGRAHVYGLNYPSKRWLLSGDDAPRGLAESQAAAEAKIATLLQLWGARIRRRRVSHPDEPHILLAHAQVGGARVAGGEILSTAEIEFHRNDLDGMPCDAGLFGHIHLLQEVAHRCYYSGSPWRNDYSETDLKSYSLAILGPDATTPSPADAARGDVYYPAVPGERLALRIERRPTACRDFRTLDYRFAATGDESAPRWITRPTDEEIAACADAEVRMRVSAPEAWVASMPWVEEVARVKATGAVRIQEERRIESTARVRAPELATATTDEERLRSFWRTLASPPEPGEQEAAIAALRELAETDDDAIRKVTDATIAGVSV